MDFFTILTHKDFQNSCIYLSRTLKEDNIMVKSFLILLGLLMIFVHVLVPWSNTGFWDSLGFWNLFFAVYITYFSIWNFFYVRRKIKGSLRVSLNPSSASLFEVIVWFLSFLILFSFLSWYTTIVFEKLCIYINLRLGDPVLNIPCQGWTIGGIILNLWGLAKDSTE